VSLADTIAQGIGVLDDIIVAEEITAGITLEAWTGQNLDGDPTYAAAVPIEALVELRADLKKNDEGTEILSKTKLTITRPIAANGAAGRREPIDPLDKITLPDGTTGPVITTEGLVDGTTDAPYMLEVWLG
jgi:hypothetical protein